MTTAGKCLALGSAALASGWGAFAGVLLFGVIKRIASWLGED